MDRVKLKLGELFAGYGGLGMAVEQVFNAELTWYAEWDDAPSKIMAHHWPGITNYRDVTTVDWSQVEPVDIISGGSPCQDLSTAGRRAGMTDGTRSNLWVSMREAIATIKPTYVVWENVRGAYSAKAESASDLEPGSGSVGDGPGNNLRALGRVLGDLAALGYDAEWRGLRAADVGAPHGRFRVFLLATRRGAKLANTNNERLERQPDPQGTAPAKRHGHTSASAERSTITDTNSAGSRGLDDAPGESPQRGANSSAIVSGSDNCRPWPIAKWGEYGQAIDRWQRIHGEAPAPVEQRDNGKYRLNARFAEWMMGLEPGHVTGVPGVTRNEQLKAIGNGVCPQQAIAALEDMLNARR